VTSGDVAFLRGGGETGALMRARDWTRGPLGPPETWPQPLKTLVGVILGSKQAMFVVWGPEHVLLYNDGYAELCRERHPAALGAPFPVVWHDIADDVATLLGKVYAGESAHIDDLTFMLIRDGRRQEAHFAFSYAPVRDDGGRIAGMFCTCIETTAQAVAGRTRRQDAERLQLAHEAAGLGTFDWDLVADRIAVSDSYLRIYGLGSVEEVTRERMLALVHPDDAERLSRVVRDAPAGSAPTEIEFRIVRPSDGETRWIRNVARTLVDDAGRPVRRIGVVRDVTARRADQEALRESEARLRLALESARMGTWEIDLASGLGTWSPITMEIYGADRAVMDREERSRFVHTDDRARVSSAVAVARETGRFACEYRAVRGDGDVRWLSSHGLVERDAGGEPVRVIGTVQDITERRQAVEALAASEGRLRRSQEAGAIGSYEWDLATGAGRQSDSMLRLVGLEPGRAHTLKELFDPILREDMPQVMETVAAIARGATRRETDYRIARPADGAVRWIRDIGQVEHDADGRPVRWVGIVQDVTDRKRAEIALRESEERLRLVQAAGRIGSFDWDIGSGHIVRSPEYVAIHGLPEGELGTDDSDRWMARIHPDDRPRVETMHREVLARLGDFENEHRIVRPVDGETRWIAIRGRLLPDAQGRPGRLVAATTDITDRKRDEERVRASEERLRLMSAAAPQLLWVAGADDRNEWVNDRWDDFAGFEVTAEPHRWVELIHPDDAPGALKAWLRSRDAGEPFEAEYRLRRADGVYRWHLVRALPFRELDGRVARWFGTSTDIEDQRRIANELRDSEARLRLAQEAGGVGLWEWDLDTGRTWWSDRLYEIVGMNPATPCTVESFRTLIHPDDLRPSQLASEAAISQGRRLDTEFRIVRPDGRTIWVASRGDVVRDDAGRAVKMVGVNFDITARKEAEAALRRLADELQDRVDATVAEREAALAQLHEAQKLETLGQLTGGVAHDFNNLLTPIVGSLDLLRRRLPDDPRATRLVDGALQAADRARTLVSRLLAFGRRQVLQARPTDVAGLLRGMTDLIQRAIGQHISVVVEPAAILPPAKVDPNQLELAVLNLAINARDAMPGGGTLTITAHPEVAKRGHRARLEPGRYVRLSVIDTGTGMDEATLKRAIEPFFTTKGVGKGTGLGLSMIHGLAGQMGGALELSSTVGIGTRVDLWLPVADADVEPVRPGPAGAPRPSATSAVVLLVDDEDLVRAGAAEMLAELGYGVVEAASGAAAIERLEAGEAVDAIVTDYLMPGMNGRELVEAARRLRPGLPALVVSGYAALDGLDLDLPLLAKPFRHDELAEAVGAMLDAKDKVISFPRATQPAR